MNAHQVLFYANTGLVVCLAGFIAAVIGAYGLESYFSLMTVTLFHVSQILLAACFKIAYVLRLAAQSQLGQSLR